MMPVDQTSILHAIEHSLFEFPLLPGRWDVPTFPGLQAHATPEVSHPIEIWSLSALIKENATALDSLHQPPT